MRPWRGLPSGERALPPAGLYAGVVLMGCAFYLYGMWENDRVDARWDASVIRTVPAVRRGERVRAEAVSLVAGLSGLVLNMALGGEFAAGAVLLIVISPACACLMRYGCCAWVPCCGSAPFYYGWAGTRLLQSSAAGLHRFGLNPMESVHHLTRKVGYE